MNQTMDQTILSMFPVVVAPREGCVPAGERWGTRYLAARDGLWREITLPWVRAVHKIAHSDMVLPYGEIHEEVTVRCVGIPRSLWRQFKSDALTSMPNEMAAALIWNEEANTWRYTLRETIEAGRGHVRYLEATLSEGEHLVVDLHSHGHFDAFFSAEDDADDVGAMKFSGVIGEVGTEHPSSALRLNMAGKTWGAKLTATGAIEVAA